jgi:hypothetical protein
MSAPALATPAPTIVPRRRRGAELSLLLIALVVGIGAYLAVDVGSSGELPEPDTYAVMGGIVMVAFVAHIAIRRLAPYADPVLLPLVVALNGLGLAMIHRIDLDLERSDSDFGPFAGAQLTWTLLGVVGFVAVLVVVRDHRRLQALTYTFGFAGLLLLLLPLVPGLGVPINGARIWIRVGPFSFQPGEIAKICLVVFFAGYLVVKRDALAPRRPRFIGIDLPRGRDLGPILVAWLVSLAVLVFQRDLGSSLLFFGLFLVLLYVATERPDGSSSAPAVRSRRVRQLLTFPTCRSASRAGSTRSPTPTPTGRSSRASTAWRTAVCWVAGWAREIRRSRPTPGRTSSSPPSARSSASPG